MSPVFERVDVPPVRDMSLGGETTTVTTEDGEVYWWGFCPATPPQLSALRPTFVPRRVHLPGTVQSLTCSSFAVFAILTEQ